MHHDNSSRQVKSAQTASCPWSKGTFRAVMVGLILCGALSTAAGAIELSCDNRDNEEQGCCCYQGAHTYLFDPVEVTRAQVTFDTGRGIGCSSQVGIAVLENGRWREIRRVNASSSSGRSEMNRLSGTLTLDSTVSGLRIDEGGRCFVDYSKIALEVRPTSVPGGPTVLPNYPITKPGRAILAEPQPPYLETPVTVEFRFEPKPIPGAIWWMDDRRMTNAEMFFWTFSTSGEHRVELRDPRGGRLAEHRLEVRAPEARQVQIVPDRQPPYKSPVTLTFRQVPEPVAGARWFLDGRLMSEAATFTWRFDDRSEHRVSLKAAGKFLAGYPVRFDQASEDLRLWGRARRGGFGSDRPETEGEALVLERSARVTAVDSNADHYCVWTAGESGRVIHRVLCGGESNPIVDVILVPGRYRVVPDLGARQRVAEVTVYLRPRQ